MIRAAIVGLGRWGRSLVASVQGKSAELYFVRGHTRTRATAEDFCRAQGVPLADSYEELLADPDIDAVVLSHLHGDHCLDMCAYAVARTYGPDGPLPQLPVYGPAGTADSTPLRRVARWDTLRNSSTVGLPGMSRLSHRGPRVRRRPSMT